MSKRRDTLTSDLFDWQPPKVAVGYGEEVTGRGALDNRIARAVSQALKEAKARDIKRADIAKAMSDYLGRPISEDMLNKWASEAADSNRITLDAFVALIDATQAHDLVSLVINCFGLVAVPAKYAAVIKLQLLRDHRAEIDALEHSLMIETKRLR